MRSYCTVLPFFAHVNPARSWQLLAGMQKHGMCLCPERWMLFFMLRSSQTLKDLLCMCVHAEEPMQPQVQR